jgi:hypothetical protein
LGGDRMVGDDLVVDDFRNSSDLLRPHRVKAGEVEPEPVGGDQRPRLVRFLTEHDAQGMVEKVSGGVIASNCLPPGGVDFRVDRLSGADEPFRHRSPVDEEIRRRFERVVDVTTPISVRIVPVSPTWPPDSP